MLIGGFAAGCVGLIDRSVGSEAQGSLFYLGNICFLGGLTFHMDVF
jgi:hypothetical protein